MDRYHNYAIKTNSGNFLTYTNNQAGADIAIGSLPTGNLTFPSNYLFKFIMLYSCNNTSHGIKMGNFDVVLEISYPKKPKFSFSVNDANYKRSCCFKIDKKTNGKYTIFSEIAQMFLREENGAILLDSREDDSSTFEFVSIDILPAGLPVDIPQKSTLEPVSRIFSEKSYLIKLKNMNIYLNLDSNTLIPSINKGGEFQLKEIKQSFIQALKLYTIKSKNAPITSKLVAKSGSVGEFVDDSNFYDLFTISHANFSNNTFWIENDGRSLRVDWPEKRVTWSEKYSDPKDPFTLFEFIEYDKLEHFGDGIVDTSIFDKKKYTIKLNDKWISVEKDIALLKSSKQIFQFIKITDKLFAINLINSDKFLNYNKEILTANTASIEQIKNDTNFENYTFVILPAGSNSTFQIKDSSEESSLKVTGNESLSMSFGEADIFEFVDESGSTLSSDYFLENAVYIIKSGNLCFSAQNDSTLRLFGTENESRYCFSENRFRFLKWGDYYKIQSIDTGKFISSGTFIHDIPAFTEYPVGVFMKNIDREKSKDGDIVYSSIFDITKLNNGYSITSIPHQTLCVNDNAKEQDQVKNDGNGNDEFQIIMIDNLVEKFESDQRKPRFFSLLILIFFSILILLLYTL